MTNIDMTTYIKRTDAINTQTRAILEQVKAMTRLTEAINRSTNFR